MRTFVTGTILDTFVVATIGNINTTSSYKDEIIDGVTYLSDNRLISVNPIVLSDIKQVTYEIVMVNVAVTSLSNGQAVTVKNVYRTGTGLTSIIAYKGVISQLSSKLVTDVIGQSIIKIICSSPMYVLDAIAGIHIHKDYPPAVGDTCFEKSQDDTSDVLINWGKKT
jgi:hypothetical protein